MKNENGWCMTYDVWRIALTISDTNNNRCEKRKKKCKTWLNQTLVIRGPFKIYKQINKVYKRFLRTPSPENEKIYKKIKKNRS